MGDFDSTGTGATTDSSLITQAAPGLKPRGYTFVSPWGGRCEFATGNGGRSLRCRHVLPNYTGNVFNPLVESDSADGPDKNNLKASLGNAIAGAGNGKKTARAVSELRFNLPTSEVLFSNKDNNNDGNGNGYAHGHGHGHDHGHGSGSGRNRASSSVGEGARIARDQLQGQFQKFIHKAAAAADRDHHNQHYPYSDDDAEDWRLDLSLGREKAGGGNRGSRAKLGKLIVAEDGLKMLDLVVAANVGVWWTSWERTFGDAL